MSTTMTAPPVSGQAGWVDDVPDPQVPERARRRTYTAKYKAAILAEYEACDRGGKGALLRREGHDSGHGILPVDGHVAARWRT